MFETLAAGASPPKDAAPDDHCRRVGAISNLIAHQLFLPTEEKQLLHSACLLHHSASPVTADVRGVLDAFLSPAAGTAAQCKLGAILRLCDAYDREYAAQSIEPGDSAQILAGLRRGVAQGKWPREIVDALQQCTRPCLMPASSAWRIPVFPQAALETLRAMRDQMASIPRVVHAARRDPATAGAILQLANSALYGDRGQVSTLQLAVARLGFETARKVVASLAMRPVLFLPKMEDLWPHSIQVADLAEQLASLTGGIDPGEAYLAGLLHDVGRIALGATTLYDAARLQGLEQSGCPAVYAENLILQADHASLGGQIAVVWRLPQHLVSAIRRHHRPESASPADASRGSLAHLLYLAEYLTGCPEDLPSTARLELSLTGLGLSARDLDRCSPSEVGSWLAAA